MLIERELVVQGSDHDLKNRHLKLWTDPTPEEITKIFLNGKKYIGIGITLNQIYYWASGEESKKVYPIDIQKEYKDENIQFKVALEATWMSNNTMQVELFPDTEGLYDKEFAKNKKIEDSIRKVLTSIKGYNKINDIEYVIEKKQGFLKALTEMFK